MSASRGMRWFKCDLQVQTPEDGRHWDSQDTDLRLGSPPERDEQDLQEKARRYLRRCHEVGLEAIGVTDHNFCSHREPRKRFLAHLIEQNREYRPPAGRAQILRPVADAPTVFQRLGVQVFSQGQLTGIARNPDFLLHFLDGLVGEPLGRLRREETELRESIRALQGQAETVERLQAEEKILEQEVQELGRRWAARSAVQDEQSRHRAAQEAQRYLGAIREDSVRTGKQLTEWGSDLAETHSPQGSIIKSWPESAYFEALDLKIEEEKHRLAGELRQAAERHQARVQVLTEVKDAVLEIMEGSEEAFRKRREKYHF